MEIEPIDHYISLFLSQEEVSYRFLAFLSKATRLGHLFVSVEDDIFPDPAALYEHPPTDEELRMGASHLQEIAGVVKVNNSYFLAKSYALIESIEKSIKEFRKPLEPIAMDASDFLSEEQKKAVVEASCSNFSVIYGGPGTGKTYTAGWLVRLTFEALTEEQKSAFTIGLVAPTGKAAQKLKSSIESVFVDKQCPHIHAMTLHALLREEVYQDLILVDESSMMDIYLLAKLLKKIKPTSRLVLMGDPNQLPPIESGAYFCNLCGWGTKLSHSHRMENLELIEAAEAIAKGVMPAFSGEKVQFKELLFDEIVKGAFPYFAQPFTTVESAFDRFDHFRLLTPLVSGPFGVDAFNQIFFEKLIEISSDMLAIPIMIAKNDYTLELFNGECGCIIVEKKSCKAVQKEGLSLRALEKGEAFFPTSQGMKRFAPAMLPPFILAFALSVHKSQGSEFKRVQLVLPKGSSSFGRQLFYTGLTRAKESVEIWSTKEELNHILSKTTYAAY